MPLTDLSIRKKNLTLCTAAPLALAFLLLAAVALSGCDKANGKAKDEQQEAAPAVPVEVAQPKVGDMVAVSSPAPA